MTSSMPSDTRLNRLYWVAAFMLLLTHAVLVWQSRSAAIEPAANDDAQYFLLARSLRSFHYRDSHIPGNPVHAQYPPVYPALIAAGTAVFGEHLGVVQVVTLLCSLLALLLIFDIARRLASPLVGILLLVPLAFNAHLLGYAGRIASEPPYMAFSFAALWVLVAFPDSRRPLLWAGVLAILAALLVLTGAGGHGRRTHRRNGDGEVRLFLTYVRRGADPFVAPISVTITTLQVLICFGTRKRRHGVRTIAKSATGNRCGGWLGSQ